MSKKPWEAAQTNVIIKITLLYMHELDMFSDHIKIIIENKQQSMLKVEPRCLLIKIMDGTMETSKFESYCHFYLLMFSKVSPCECQ